MDITEMVDSHSSSTKSTPEHNKTKDAVHKTITIVEKINLSKKQHEVLNMICNLYEISISDYMKEALIQSMKNDVEDGNFCDVLLEKLDGADKKKKNSSPPSAANTINDDLEMIKKLQTGLP
jgi:hypothetical protein